MKEKITLFVLLFSSFIFGQQLPIDSITGKVSYEKVVNLPGQTKQKNYEKAKSWIITTLKSSDNMTSVDNEDQLVGSGTIALDSFKLPYWGASYTPAKLNFKFIVYCKEGKVKYKVDNFLLIYQASTTSIIETELVNIKPGADNWNKKMKEKFKETVALSVNSNVEALIANFIATMKSAKNDDW